MKFDLEECREKLRNTKKVLVAIGPELEEITEEEKQQTYQTLNSLLQGKDYYIASLCTDGAARLYLGDTAKLACMLKGEELDMNSDEVKEYNKFIMFLMGKECVILELGVGFYYPEAVRFPFEKITQYNNKAYFVRVNDSIPQIPEDIVERACSVYENAVDFIRELEA